MTTRPAAVPSTLTSSHTRRLARTAAAGATARTIRAAIRDASRFSSPSAAASAAAHASHASRTSRLFGSRRFASRRSPFAAPNSPSAISARPRRKSAFTDAPSSASAGPPRRALVPLLELERALRGVEPAREQQRARRRVVLERRLAAPPLLALGEQGGGALVRAARLGPRAALERVGALRLERRRLGERLVERELVRLLPRRRPREQLEAAAHARALRHARRPAGGAVRVRRREDQLRLLALAHRAHALVPAARHALVVAEVELHHAGVDRRPRGVVDRRRVPHLHPARHRRIWPELVAGARLEHVLQHAAVASDVVDVVGVVAGELGEIDDLHGLRRIRGRRDVRSDASEQSTPASNPWRRWRRRRCARGCERGARRAEAVKSSRWPPTAMGCEVDLVLARHSENVSWAHWSGSVCPIVYTTGLAGTTELAVPNTGAPAARCARASPRSLVRATFCGSRPARTSRRR